MPERRGPALELLADRYWDEVFRGEPAGSPTDDFDPDLAATVRRLRALDAAPAADPVFASRLWEDLMHARSLNPVVGLPSGPLPTAAASPPRPFGPVMPIDVPPRRRWGAAPFATAALLLLTVGLGYIAFGPGRPRTGERPAVAPAVVATPATPEPAATEDDALLTVTLPAAAFPRGPNVDSVLIDVVIPPGTRSTWQPVCCAGPLVEYVVAGTFTVRADAATRVVRADGAVEEVPAATEATLGAGDALVSRNETAYEAANTGAEPVLLLNWVLRVDDSDGEYLQHLLPGWGASPNYDGADAIDPPPGAGTVRLRRVTLGEGEVVPAPPAGTLQLGAPQPVAAANGMSASMPLTQSIVDGSIGNPNQQPVDVYLLTLEPV